MQYESMLKRKTKTIAYITNLHNLKKNVIIKNYKYMNYNIAY